MNANVNSSKTRNEHKCNAPKGAKTPEKAESGKKHGFSWLHGRLASLNVAPMGMAILNTSGRCALDLLVGFTLEVNSRAADSRRSSSLTPIPTRPGNW